MFEKGKNIVQYFKDDTTAFNGERFEIKEGKGVLNNAISSFFMENLEKNSVATHFLEKLDERHQLVKKVKIIPLEVIIRNVTAGSFCKKFGVERGKTLPFPLVEFSLKDDSLGDPLIPETHIFALKIATEDEISQIKEMALKVNTFLQSQFEKIELLLVDFKIEFGRHGKKIILADEISPDSCRLWQKGTLESFDKDLFREQKGEIVEAYREIARRLGIL